MTDGCAEGRGVVGEHVGPEDGIAVGVLVGVVDEDALKGGNLIGLCTTTPPPEPRLKSPAMNTSSNPSPFISPTPPTTRPLPVITTPCEAVVIVTLVTFTVLFPKIR